MGGIYNVIAIRWEREFLQVDGMVYTWHCNVCGFVGAEVCAEQICEKRFWCEMEHSHRFGVKTCEDIVYGKELQAMALKGSAIWTFGMQSFSSARTEVAEWSFVGAYGAFEFFFVGVI
jgi:hypothetical protein